LSVAWGGSSLALLPLFSHAFSNLCSSRMSDVMRVS
jgi:hypothetical protein